MLGFSINFAVAARPVEQADTVSNATVAAHPVQPAITSKEAWIVLVDWVNASEFADFNFCINLLTNFSRLYGQDVLEQKLEDVAEMLPYYDCTPSGDDDSKVKSALAAVDRQVPESLRVDLYYIYALCLFGYTVLRRIPSRRLRFFNFVES